MLYQHDFNGSMLHKYQAVCKKNYFSHSGCFFKNIQVKNVHTFFYHKLLDGFDF